MSLITIVSANPQMLCLAASTIKRSVLLQPRASLPSFLAKVYGFAKTGTTKPTLTSGNNRLLMFGAESL